MNPEHWPEVQRLFHAIAELNADQRDEYLRNACDNQDIRREVEGLLSWQELSTDFIETPAIEVAALTLATHVSELSPGQMLDRYRILSRVGSGGMGVVYQAEDTRLGRAVALKFLQETFTGDTAALDRFRAEARILSSLNHPNICSIYDIAEADGHIFIAMEYIAGRPLDQMVRSGAMSSLHAIGYAVQIAAGLARAHAAGIVHRDLKPSNIMLSDDGWIKLLDFGVAKLIRPASEVTGGGTTLTLTGVGTVIGTAAYMSPEQAEARTVDARSDIFALGSVLYEMITGRRAFEGSSTIATLAAILRFDPPPMSRVTPSVPHDLDSIVARCLSKDPADRFQTAAELGQSLEELRSDTTTRTAAIRFISGTVKRKGVRWALTFCIIALIVILAVVFGRPGKIVSPIPADKRIAVLVFRNVGGDPANQALCDGLVEEVSNALTRLEQFHGALVVVPASDILKENITSASEAGRKLGANLAITGSVERSSAGTPAKGGTVRVLINLVDTRTVTQLRTESIDTRDPDLPDLQDGVNEKVARMLELVLKPEAQRGVRVGNTPKAGAYAEYIQGLGYLRRYDRVENIDSAIGAFRRALAIDSHYVLALSGMAEAYWRRYEALKDSPDIDFALEYSSQALALNDSLAPVHITMGIVRAGKGQYEMAESEFKTALKLDPLNASAWLELANIYDATGRNGRAQPLYRTAMELRNDDWATLNKLGVSYFTKAQYQEAEPYFLEVVQLRPDSAKAYSNLGGLYLKMGRFEDAAVQLQKSISIEQTAAGWSNLGASYYFAGRYPDAIMPFEKATGLSPANSALWGNLADAYRWTPSEAAKAPDTYRHALDLIRNEIAVNDRDPQLHAKAATWWAALGEKEKAVAEIAQALSLAPQNATVQFRAALVYEQAHQRDRALHAIGVALEAGYDRPEIDHAPPLKNLREDSQFRRMIQKYKTLNSH